MTTTVELPDEIVLNITKYDIQNAIEDRNLTGAKNHRCPSERALDRWLKKNDLFDRYPEVGVTWSLINGLSYTNEQRLRENVIWPFDGDRYKDIKPGRYKMTKM